VGFSRVFSEIRALFSLHLVLAGAPWVVGFGLGSPDEKWPNPTNFGLLGPQLGVLDPSGNKIRHEEGVLESRVEILLGSTSSIF
jgi:hypothetical protein